MSANKEDIGKLAKALRYTAQVCLICGVQRSYYLLSSKSKPKAKHDGEDTFWRVTASDLAGFASIDYIEVSDAVEVGDWARWIHKSDLEVVITLKRELLCL